MMFENFWYTAVLTLQAEGITLKNYFLKKLNEFISKYCKTAKGFPKYILSGVQFDILRFIPIWAFKFCHNLRFWVLLQFDSSKFKFLSFVTIWAFEFLFFKCWVFNCCQNLRFWVLSQFEFLSFITIWVCLVLSQFEFLSYD